MYLVTVYFDERTNHVLQNYIDVVAKQSGNPFMIQHKVPPHMTIAQVETRHEERLVECVDGLRGSLRSGDVDFVSMGVFSPYVLYAAGVYNEALHGLMADVHRALDRLPETNTSVRYRPFSFVPHVTLGKTLEETQMIAAIEGMRRRFVPFRAVMTEIGLSKVHPYTDLLRYKLV